MASVISPARETKETSSIKCSSTANSRSTAATGGSVCWNSSKTVAPVRVRTYSPLHDLVKDDPANEFLSSCRRLRPADFDVDGDVDGDDLPRLAVGLWTVFDGQHGLARQGVPTLTATSTATTSAVANRFRSGSPSVAAVPGRRRRRSSRLQVSSRHDGPSPPQHARRCAPTRAHTGTLGGRRPPGPVCQPGPGPRPAPARCRACGRTPRWERLHTPQARPCPYRIRATRVLRRFGRQP